MQAAAGQVSWPHDPEAVAGRSRSSARPPLRTLTDLDRLGPEGRSPARGMGDLPELVARIRATGTPVDLTVLGEPADGARPVVHRVVQEALTNAVRHAPGAAVSVLHRARAGRLVVTVQRRRRRARPGRRPAATA